MPARPLPMMATSNDFTLFPVNECRKSYHHRAGDAELSLSPKKIGHAESIIIPATLIPLIWVFPDNWRLTGSSPEVKPLPGSPCMHARPRKYGEKSRRPEPVQVAEQNTVPALAMLQTLFSQPSSTFLSTQVHSSCSIFLSRQKGVAASLKLETRIPSFSAKLLTLGDNRVTICAIMKTGLLEGFIQR